MTQATTVNWERIEKVLNLAARPGTDGERTAAKSRLEAMLESAGITRRDVVRRGLGRLLVEAGMPIEDPQFSQERVQTSTGSRTSPRSEQTQTVSVRNNPNKRNMVARFSSVCPDCGNGIKAGTTWIYWVKGSPAVHMECPAKVNRANSQTQAQGRMAKTGRVNPKVQNGIYTVEFDGTYRTIRISDCDFGEFAEGTQVAEFLRGQDNESDYAGFAFVQGSTFKVWSRFADAAELIKALDSLLQADDAGSYGEAYARRSGRCWRCGRTLTVPSSLHRGLGPDCAKKVGWA